VTRPGARLRRAGRRVLLGLALGVLGALGLLAGPAAPASAHATLLRTAPAAGAILDQQPTELGLDFSEPVDLGLATVTVLDPGGTQVQQGRPAQGGAANEVVVRLRDGLRDGTYLVTYRVVSADGHPISGGYAFSIGAPSQQARPATASGAAPVDPVVRGLQSAGRYLTYGGMVLVAGPLLVLLALWPRRLSTAGPRRLLAVGVGGVAVGTLVTAGLQAPYVLGVGLAEVGWAELRDVLGTGVGKALLARLALLGALLPLLLRVARGREPGAVDRVLLGGLGAGLLLTFPLAGHAAASPGLLLAVPADAVHVAAMSVWLGGLVVLALHLLPAARPDELAALLPVWSRWAAYAVVALVLSGSVQALLEVGGLRGLTGTTYGRLVLAKIALLAVLLAIAATARSWVRRHHALPVAHALDVQAPPVPGPPPVRALRARVVAEIALGALVLALATALVQVTPGRTAVEAAVPADLPYTTTLTARQLVLQVDVDPARTGTNSVHVTAFTPDGSPQRVVEWKATASLPSAGVEDVTVVLLPVTDNHVTGQVTLPAAGDWVLAVTARTSEVDQATVRATVPVR